MLDEEFKDSMLVHMATQTTEMKNMNEWVKGIDTKVTKIQTEGCVKGITNEARIDKIEAVPQRQGMVGATVGGGGIAALLLGVFKAWEFFTQ